MLSLEEFIKELSQYWMMQPDELDPDRPLDELGIDSLATLELVVMLEDFAGHELPDEVWEQTTTLRDIHSTFEIYASRDRVSSGSNGP